MNLTTYTNTHVDIISFKAETRIQKMKATLKT